MGSTGEASARLESGSYETGELTAGLEWGGRLRGRARLGRGRCEAAGLWGEKGCSQGRISITRAKG